MGFFIPNDAIIFIMPCYGETVNNEYGKRLKNNKIFLLSIYSQGVFTWTSANKYKKTGYLLNAKRKGRNVDFLVGNSSEFPNNNYETRRLTYNMLYKKTK
jgi:hypothetical protein